MGLDMYLSAKRYVSNYDFHPEEQELNKTIKQALGLSHLNRSQSSVEVTVNVAYWRKANQIHGWFVKNVQGGEDNCQPHYVSRENLEELLETVDYVLTSRDANELPPCEGFFFGSREVDEWYWDDMSDTHKILTDILNDPALKGYEFEYQSSW